jgi:hypothetical protein
MKKEKNPTEREENPKKREKKARKAREKTPKGRERKRKSGEEVEWRAGKRVAKPLLPGPRRDCCRSHAVM